MADRTPVSLAQRSLHHGHTRRARKAVDPKVPVVRVNPFLSEREHTWSKEKSLPEFYEKPDIVHTSTEAFVKPPPTAFSTSSDSMLTTRENRPILPLAQLNKPNLEAANVSSTPPKTSPAKVQLFEEPPYIENVRGRRIIFPPTPRDQCISPENPIKRLPKHGFAPTIVDREKKTVIESPVTKPTSLLNRERTQDFVNKQQNIRLRGLRLMDGGHLGPAPSTYIRTTALPVKSLEDFYSQIVSTYSRGYAFSPNKTRHSHNFSHFFGGAKRHMQGDPLLALNHENMASRYNSSMDSIDSKSAFRILESAGKPTYIEQNLARDYTQFYDTTKHGSPVNTGHHFTRFLKLKNYNPTQGELFIMVNKEQNKPGNWSPRGHYAPSKPQHSAMPRTATWDYSVEGRETLQTEVLPVASSQDLAPPTQPEDLNANESSNSRGKITPEREEMRSPSCNEEKLQERLEISTTLPDINAVVTA